MKSSFSSIISQFILLIFVIVWIIPTFGLFVSSFRDKDLLAISGWWTSLITNEVNEIHRTYNKDNQIEEENIFIIKGNLFDNIKGKKIISFGITSKRINEFLVTETATLKNGSQITVLENGDYKWESLEPFKNKKGKRIFITALSPPKFTFYNYNMLWVSLRPAFNFFQSIPYGGRPGARSPGEHGVNPNAGHTRRGIDATGRGRTTGEN